MGGKAKAWPTLFALGLIAFLTQTTSALASTEWSSPVDVTSTDDSVEPSIAIDNLNHLHAVWKTSSDGGATYSAQYSRSVDGGVSWSAPVTISDPSVSVNSVRVVVAGNNSVHAFWRGYNSVLDTGLLQYASSFDNGGHWSSSESLSDNDENSGVPFVSIDSNDNLHVATWLEYSVGFINFEEVRAYSSEDYGVTWDATQIDFGGAPGDGDGSLFGEMSIASDASGGVHLVYTTRDTPTYWARYAHYVPDDGWNGSAYYVSDEDLNSAEPVVVVTPAGEVVCVYRQKDGDGIWRMRSSYLNEDETWGSSDSFAIGDQRVWNVEAITDTSGQIYSSWVQSNGTNYLVRGALSADGGRTWESLVTVSEVGEDGLWPQLATNSTGQIFAVWFSFNGDHYVVKFSKADDFGSPWSEPISLSEPAQDSVEPVIAMASNDTLHALWYQDDFPLSIIQSAYLNTAQPASSTSSQHGRHTEGVPGIFLTVVGEPDLQFEGSEVRFGAYAIRPNSNYQLTLESITDPSSFNQTLATGRANDGGHLERTIELPHVPAGNYKIILTGTGAGGERLKLANHVNVDGAGKFTSVSAERLQPVLN